MAQKYMCIYYDMLPAFEKLTDEELGRLLRAALVYSLGGAAPDLPGNEDFVWPLLQAQIDRASEKYTKMCETNKRIATERNEPSRVVTDRNEALRTVTDRDAPSRSVTRQDNTIQEENKTPYPVPTFDEVESYAKLKAPHVDIDYFYNYYTETHWCDISGEPIHNWKTVLLSWESKEKAKLPAEGSYEYWLEHDTSWKTNYIQGGG